MWRWAKVGEVSELYKTAMLRRLVHYVAALKTDFILHARGFCTDFSLPVRSGPLRGLC